MTRFAAAAAMGIVLVVIYGLRLDDVAGLYIDDAYYVVLAQALAQGQGYALISSATTPILPAFPPGFPLLLAPVIAFTQPFPGNIAALKAVSILAMLGVAALTYHYLIAHRELDRGRAAAIAMLTALLPGFVFLATSTLMAECVFTLALVASAIAIERAASGSKRRGRESILAGVLCTAAWLVRSAGITAVIAGAFILVWRRGWRAGAGFLAVCALCYAPWYVYALAHQPTAEARTAHGGSIVYSYRALLSMRVGGSASSGVTDAGGLVTRVATNVANVVGRDIGAVIFPAAYRGPGESGQEVFQLSGAGPGAGSMGLGAAVVVPSAALSLLVVIGWTVMIQRRVTAGEVLSVLTIATVVLVPSRTFRYVLPIAPFLLSYFFAGIEWLTTRLRGAGAAVPAVRVAAACLVVMLGAEHLQYIALKFGGPVPDWIADGNEVRYVTDWLNGHLRPGGAAATTNPGLLYLLTGRRTVALVEPSKNWQRWQDSGIRYAVALHITEKPAASLGYRLLYESPRLKLWALELPPPDRK